jgi:hypothetical protein
VIRFYGTGSALDLSEFTLDSPVYTAEAWGKAGGESPRTSLGTPWFPEWLLSGVPADGQHHHLAVSSDAGGVERYYMDGKEVTWLQQYRWQVALTKRLSASLDRWRRLFGSPDARVFILSDRLVVLKVAS